MGVKAEMKDTQNNEKNFVEISERINEDNSELIINDWDFKNIFILGLSCDGIFNGINFMNYYIKKDLSESQILNNIIEIYDIDIFPSFFAYSISFRFCSLFYFNSSFIILLYNVF